MAKKVVAKKSRKGIGGRPPKYRPEYARMAYHHCLLRGTKANLAQLFDVSRETIYAWMREHQEFSDNIKLGTEGADEAIAKSLFHRAAGYTVKETKVFCQNGEIITHDIDKHVPADVNAAKFWLSNRAGDAWKDKQDVDMTVSGSIDIAAILEAGRKRALDVKQQREADD